MCNWRPLVAYETNGESQTILENAAECESLPMAIPLYACERGIASASVRPIDGATYLWSAEGATITGGDGTPRVTLALTDPAAARVTVVVTTPGCSRSASGVIAIRKPLALANLKVPDKVDNGQSVTIEWSYLNGGDPGSQILKGSAFGSPVPLSR